MITVCVDAMGGDLGPSPVLAGVKQAISVEKDVSVLLAGNSEVVEPFAQTCERVTPLISTQNIEMAEHPAEAVRKKKDSSIVKGCHALKEGSADAFFSPGSTGAILTAATLYTGRIRGIHRPALAVAAPAIGGGHTVISDLGANSDCTPAMIVQFANMASIFSNLICGVEHPRLALLSNGSEDTKGSELSLSYFSALKEADSSNFEFCGNAEGTDILAGTYDVIVADGFTGNIALKSLEGTAKFIANSLKSAASKSVKTAIGALLIKGAFKEVASQVSGDEYGGAMLLGIKSPVFIGHGKTSETAVKNGILAAYSAVKQDLCGKIAASVASNK